MEDEEGPQRRRKSPSRGGCRFFQKSIFNRCFLDGGREVRLHEKITMNRDDWQPSAFCFRTKSRKSQKVVRLSLSLSLSPRCRVSFESFCSVLPFLGSLIRNFTLKFSVLSNFQTDFQIFNFQSFQFKSFKLIDKQGSEGARRAKKGLKIILGEK